MQPFREFGASEDIRILHWMGMFTGHWVLRDICSDMGQMQNMDVTVSVKNTMSPSHFYSSKQHISTCMVLIATRDDDTACVRCRGPREMEGPDSDQFKGYTPTSLMCGIGAVCDTLFSRPLITGNQVILALLNEIGRAHV